MSLVLLPPYRGERNNEQRALATSCINPP